MNSLTMILPRPTQERDRHVLLDSCHLRSALGVRQKNRRRCAAFRCRSHQTRRTARLPEVLPMGLFCAVLAGHSLLHTALFVETLGR